LSKAELYQLMPPLSGEEYQALKNDIRRRGVLVPIEKDENGNTLDGHHRLRIVEELRAEGVRVDFPSIIRAGLTEQEKRSHVRALNLHRRHLSQAKRRELIADQLRDTPERSNRQVASALGVSPTTVGTIRQRLEADGDVSRLDTRTDSKGRKQPSCKPPKSGSPSIIAKNEKETQRALEALDGLNADVLPDHPIHVRLLERYRRESDAATRVNGVEAHPSIIADVDIFLGDFREALRHIASESADLILTDVPYAQEHVPLWGDLAAFAARTLRNGGLLVAYSGQAHLPHVLNHLSAHLQYVWMIAQIGMARKGQVYTINARNNWKPIVVYAKGKRDPITVFDDVLQGLGPEKESHVWQQREDEAKRLVEMFSRPGDLVIDPFVGSGTMAIAAITLGRRFVGCDIDPVAVSTSWERMRLVLPGQG
jgi:hypothetical protein